MTLRLEVMRSDATAIVGIPALVIPANKQLTLGWGSHLAEKVAKLAGPEVEAAALSAHPGGVALGEAVLTDAGRLETFTHLIHAAVLDKFDFNPLFLLRLRERTSAATLRGATRASLSLAHDAGLSGLVFTAMGAGIGGMRLKKCVRIIAEETRAFGAACPESCVTRVVLACTTERDARIARGAGCL